MKNKYYLDTQTDKIWCNDTMAMQGDTLGIYGCLVTALSNTKILQGKPYTPRILNEKLKANKGYAGLRYTNLKKDQSFIMWDSDANGKGVNEILGCSIKKDIKITLPEINKAINTGLSFFIARVYTSYRNAQGVIKKFGHYINILFGLNNKYICFDTYDGKLNTLKKNYITLIIRVDYD